MSYGQYYAPPSSTPQYGAPPQQPYGAPPPPQHHYSSAPPPPPANVNPDRRQLPEGWATQWEPNYNAWFYVDLRSSPSYSTWDHPLGLHPPTGPYAPPAEPPKGYYGTPLSGVHGNGARAYEHHESHDYGHGDSHGGHGDSSAVKKAGGLAFLGKYLGGDKGHSSHGDSHASSHGYGHGDSSHGYHDGGKKEKKSGVGMGTVAAVGAGGVVGGVLIASALDDDSGDAYQAGYEDGAEYAEEEGGSDSD